MVITPEKQMALKPVPSPEWQATWDELMADPWLVRKTDRVRRLNEHVEYVAANFPHLASASRGLLIDVGCGPGELLEIARFHGHDHLGVDAASGEGGMGDAYVLASRLMHERQGLTVKYGRFLDLLPQIDFNPSLTDGLVDSAVAINFRGSIEQVFSEFMDGEPHHRHHDCHRLSWRLCPELDAALRRLFGWAAQVLRPCDGVMVIAANGAKNAEAFRQTAVRAAFSQGLDIEIVSDTLLRFTR